MDYIITSVRTRGHSTGVTEVIKEKFPNLKVIAVEPELSPILSGGTLGSPPLQEIGAGFIPENYHSAAIDEVIQVSRTMLTNFTRQIARNEGILVGISGGSSLAAIAKKLCEILENAIVLTFNYDIGERYLSVEGLF